MALTDIFKRGRQGERDLSRNLNELDDDHMVVKLDAVTANTTFSVPAGYRLSSLDIVNTTAVAVGTGIRVGTAAGASDVVGATGVGANAIVTPALAKSLFSLTAAQTLYLEAVTTWDGASLRVRAVLEQVF